MSVQAVLWDMDGLLVDTEPLWTVAEHEFAAVRGGVFTAEAKAAIVGTRLDVSVPLLLGFLGCPVTPGSVERGALELLTRMAQLFSRPLELRPGVAELLADVAAAGVPQALVSSSYRVLVDAVLSHGVGPFVLTLAGDEVEHGKPDPDPYLAAAAALGVDPRRCVVLEDSPSGVSSAQAAGCAVVAVPSVAPVVLDARTPALVVAGLDTVSFADLLSLSERGRVRT